MLQIDGLCCRLGRREVLQDITLALRPGEVLGLIGPNGAGKSTLIRSAAGLLRPSAGRILVEGRALPAWPRQALARQLAYVGQAAGPAMALTVYDMVALGRVPHRGLVDAATDRGIVINALQRLGLAALALRPVAQLSGGERQRVVMARALAQQGRLLLLDEPTSALDLRHQLATLRCLRALADEGAAVLVALHDLTLAARFCDRLLLLHQGRMHAQGPPRQVLTTAHLAQVYGVAAQIGEAAGCPFVIPLDDLQAPA